VVEPVIWLLFAIATSRVGRLRHCATIWPFQPVADTAFWTNRRQL